MPAGAEIALRPRLDKSPSGAPKMRLVTAEVSAIKGKEALPPNATWDTLVHMGPDVTPVPGRPNIALFNANHFQFGIGNLGAQAIAIHELQQGSNVHFAFANTMRPDKPFLNSTEQVKESDGASAFDVIGISVPFEDTYVNALNMMGDAGLHLRSEDRLDDNDSPLVISGGMGMINPMPLSPFMDVMVLKEGREAFHEISTRYSELKKKGISKREALEALADIEGVFIPSLYHIEYDQEGYLTKFEPRQLVDSNGVPRDVQPPREIRAQEALDMVEHPLFSRWTSKYATYEEENYVSVMAAMGCDKACKFCVVGLMQGDNDGKAMKTDMSTILDIVDARTAEHRAKGEDDPVVKVFFSSAFSAGTGGVDGGSIKDLLKELRDRELQGRVGSLNIQQADEELFQLVSAVGQKEVTFAPETTQQARSLLGKAYSKDAKLLEVAEWCSKYGLDLNVYSLGSLPGETDADTLEYAQFLRQIREKMGPDQQMAVHYNPVFHKPQTDLEILGNVRPAEARRKLQLLQEALGDDPSIRIISVIDNPMVYYQPLLALGDSQSADLLEHLSKTHRGKLQSEITETEWHEAVDATGFDDTRYFSDKDPKRILPWEPFVFGKVSHERRKTSGLWWQTKAVERARSAPVAEGHVGYSPVAAHETDGDYSQAHVTLDIKKLGLDQVNPTDGGQVSSRDAYLQTWIKLLAGGMNVDVSRVTNVDEGRIGFNLSVPSEGLAHLDPTDRIRAIRAHFATTVVESMGLGDKLVRVPAWQGDTPGGVLFVPDQSVFPPSDFGQILTTKILPLYVQDGHVLDMGTASTIIGVGAAREGAQLVTATDINPVAVDIAAPVSWAVNGFAPQRLRTIVSDGFKALGDARFDAILSNPPVQPDLGGPKANWQGFNESGEDGRGLLDALLSEVPHRLRERGVAIITSSSRHGPEITEARLHSLEEEGLIAGHEIVYRETVKLDPDQYGDYVPFWLTRGSETGVPRIYQTGSESGKPTYAHDLYVYAVHK